MLVHRVSAVALLATLPLVLAHCGSDTTSGGAAGSPAVAGAPAAGSPGSAGAPAAGSPAVAGAPAGGSPAAAGAPAGGSASGGAGSGAGGASGGTTSSGGSGGGSSAGAAGKAGGGSGGGSTGTFTLTSPDLANGAKFADKNTCNGKMFGEDESPALNWSGAPAGTKSFAITFLDMTILGATPMASTGHHWAAWNIPATATGLPANLPTGATLTTPVPLKQTPTSYLGPCPGHPGTDDTYEFTIYALPTETVDPGAGSALSYAMVQKIKMGALGSAVLSGKSDAKSK